VRALPRGETNADGVLAAHLDPHDALELVSSGARAVLGLPATGIVTGSPADLVAIGGSSLREAMATATEHRLVIRRGSFVSRTRLLHEAPGQL